MQINKKTFKIGDSVGVILPAHKARETGIKAGSEVCIDVENGKIVIAPLPPAKIEAVQANTPGSGVVANDR